MFGVAIQPDYHNAAAVHSDSNHDWFCFHCHRAGGVLKGCANCFRVYHDSCLPPTKSSELFICPVCSLSQKVPVAIDRTLMASTMEKLLLWAQNKGGPAFSVLSTTPSPSNQFRIAARPMDLTLMRTKLKSGHYMSPGQFLADFQHLAHNIAVVYGADTNMGQLAADLVKQVETELNVLEQSSVAPPGLLMKISLPSTSKDGDSEKTSPAKKDKSRKSKSDEPNSASKKRKKSSDIHNGIRTSSETDDSHMVTSSCENDSFRSVAVQTLEGLDAQPGSSKAVSCDCSSRYRKSVVSMQQEWLSLHKLNKEAALTGLAEELQADFEANQEKLRKEMLTQFKMDMESTKNDLDQKYTTKLQQEMSRQQEKYKSQISDAKKKQWCWACESEAIYHCCWNTSYCSVECQQQHWPQHRKYCRRKKH